MEGCRLDLEAVVERLFVDKRVVDMFSIVFDGRKNFSTVLRTEIRVSVDECRPEEFDDDEYGLRWVPADIEWSLSFDGVRTATNGMGCVAGRPRSVAAPIFSDTDDATRARETVASHRIHSRP